MPLDEVVRAHTMMEKNEQIGKIVLTMEWIVCLKYLINFSTKKREKKEKRPSLFNVVGESLFRIQSTCEMSFILISNIAL